MKRASSTSAIRIEFDPRQAKIGHSSIDKLPIRRVNSTKSLSKASQKQPKIESSIKNQQYHIDLLERMNKSLQKQNQFLKKQLQCYTNTCSSRRSSINQLGTSSKKQEQREKLLSRLEAKPDKNDTESTGLFNSKMSSARKHADDSIAEIYDKYTLKTILPRPDYFLQILKNYQQDIKDNYLKIKTILDKIKIFSQKTKSVLETQTIKDIEKITNVIQWIVLNQSSHNPTKPLKSIKNSKDQLMEDFFNQFSSQNQTLAIFEILMGKVCKTAKMMEKVKNSLGFARFIRKINRLE